MKPMPTARTTERTVEGNLAGRPGLAGAARTLTREAERKPLVVRDLMTPDPQTLAPSDDLSALYDLLDTRQVRDVPVVDAEGDLVGLVTHRDLLRCALGEEEDLPLSLQREMLTRKTVGEIMTSDPETTDPDSTIVSAAQTMLENKYGCLPIVEGTRLVGILTESDFVRYLAEQGRRSV